MYKLIFVSCGQQNHKEKTIGEAIRKAVDSTSGFKAYFAESVQSLEGLTENIFTALHGCVGMIAVLHDRGKVIEPNGTTWGIRSSVWINQEIAILAYRRHIDKLNIPLLCFKAEDIRLEGAMTGLITNPKILRDPSVVAQHVKDWLTSTQFPTANYVASDRFLTKWNKLSTDTKLVNASLLDEGGRNVKMDAVIICLEERYGMDNDTANKALQNARLKFASTDLVKEIHNIRSQNELKVNPTWGLQLREAVEKYIQDHKT